MKKQILNLVVNPNKVLIKVTKAEWNDLFSIWITRADGTREQLFKSIEEEEGFEQRFKQNVSVGNIVAVGTNVKGIMKGDIAIIDYLVTGADDGLVGVQGGNRLVAITGKTTYHESNSVPMLDGRLTWKEGDFKEISPLLGVVRMARLKAFHPHVFLEYQNPTRMVATPAGLVMEHTDNLCTRKVLSASPESGYADGDTVLIKEGDLFFRTIDKKMISVVFEDDILAKI